MKKVILVAFIIIIAGGGYLYIKNKKVNPSEPAKNETHNDLKTYTNSQYGFQFQYPPNLIIYYDQDGKLIIDTPETKKLFEDKSLDRVGDLLVYVEQNPSGLQAADFFNRPNSLFNNPEKITVGNNISAYKLPDSTSPSLHSYVIIPGNNIFVEFTSFLDIGIFDQILSTFKFTK